MKNKHYYNGQLIVTSTHIYKYGLVYFNVTKGTYIKMGVSNNIETLRSKARYFTKGYGQNFEGSGLWSSQFHNPALMHVVKLEVK